MPSGRDDQETEHERACKAADEALRRLTANLLRVTRGAGKPWEIVGHAAEFVLAVEAAQRTSEFGYSPERASAALRLEHFAFDRTREDIEMRMKLDAEHRIVCGALQIAASDLLGQNTHLQRGATEMSDGIRDLEDARAAIRQKYLR
ncbi:hypothetical protein SAMN05444722_1722 [Rhodovulum sp. ES.010]|uniref:hypothetical protein n=1 Tax=Rhodovulum sp. ES.010 TaxID=1882821 RepID=UPI000926666A|nr:hypothetical protein [Rhodovulum sp. ES.010]SIO37069.1 hypothetical protein SAMN05444722_1722 [Rhodovulum sp. ES.010]